MTGEDMERMLSTSAQIGRAANTPSRAKRWRCPAARPIVDDDQIDAERTSNLRMPAPAGTRSSYACGSCSRRFV